MPYDSDVSITSKKAPAGHGAPLIVIRTGAAGQPTLQVSNTSNYVWLYNDSGSGAHMDVTLYRPAPTDTSFFIIGDYAQGNYSAPVGASLTVRAINDDPNNPLLMPPITFQQVWNDGGSGGHNDGSVWFAVPPDGYISIGFLGQAGYDMPNVPSYRCVRRDLAVQTEVGSLIWSDQGSGAHDDVSLYTIVGVPNAFVAQANYQPFSGSVFKLKGT
jgi:hypothetical protein